MIISPKALKAYRERSFDSWLWMKALKREELLAELARLRVPPVFKTEPWLHQLVCFWIAICRPEFLFLLDMGLGKSKIIIDRMTHAQRERQFRRALVTVPRIINIDSWSDGIKLHSDLEPWPINQHEIEAKRELLLAPKGDIALIDYQGLHWALCDKVRSKGKKQQLVRNDKLIRMFHKLYNFIVMDESHYLMNHESLWFGIMRQMCNEMDFRYGMTGTLFGKDPEGIWSQFFLVDQGDTFGPNLGLFRACFFTAEPSKWGRGVSYTYDGRRNSLLHRMLGHRSLRYDEDEVLDLPERVARVSLCSMAPEQREHYLRAVEGLLNAQGKLSELDAPYIRMRQITSGYLRWKDDSGEHLVHFDQNPKLDLLEKLLDEMGAHNKAVIVYTYTETGRMIVDRVKKLGIDCEWLYGNTKDKSACRRRFMDDERCRVLVMQVASGAEGNDGLQRVARYMFLYETPSSPILRKQVIKRIHRPGQRFRCFIYDLVMQRSLDKGILDDLRDGIDTHDSIVNGRKLQKSFLMGE